MSWRIAVFVAGLLPALLAATGIAMWLSDRRTRRLLTPPDEAVLAEPAE